ncbi:MAG: regulatory signaling modulator protein AmpE, partial [Enterobacteriaceae bacterium]
MTLFMLLLVLAWERLFKMGEHWQLERRLSPLFALLPRAALWQTLLLTLGWMLLIMLLFWLLQGLLYHFVVFVLALLLCTLCLGAGELRQFYRDYL